MESLTTNFNDFENSKATLFPYFSPIFIYQLLHCISFHNSTKTKKKKKDNSKIKKKKKKHQLSLFFFFFFFIFNLGFYQPNSLDFIKLPLRSVTSITNSEKTTKKQIKTLRSVMFFSNFLLRFFFR